MTNFAVSSLVLSGLVAYIELTLVSTALVKIVRGNMRPLYRLATLLELVCAAWLAVAVSTAGLAAVTLLFLAFAAYRFAIARRRSACACAGEARVVETPEALGVLALAGIAGMAAGLSAAGWSSYGPALVCAALTPPAVHLYGRWRAIHLRRALREV